jgi:lipooligosaccharide transport system permease protein
MTNALRMVQRNALVYRHVWRGSVFASFGQPIGFLLAMGVGLGKLVDRGSAPLPGGITYLAFLAPGLLAAACMQTAAFECTYPIAAKTTWRHNYEALDATPLSIWDVVIGELTWMALRLLMVSTSFMAALALFGVVHSARAWFAIPAATLTGLAFAAPLVAFAVMRKTGADFNVVFRFGITPLFLFSGVFFPIAQLPHALQIVAAFTPLFHGVELVRGLVLDTLDARAAIVHVAYLAMMVAGGTVAARVTLDRKLHP